MEGAREIQSVRLSIEISGTTYNVEVPEASAELTRAAIGRVEKEYDVFMDHNRAVFSDIVMRRIASLVMVAIASEVRAMGAEGRQMASGALFNELRGLRLSIDEFLAHSRGEQE